MVDVCKLGARVWRPLLIVLMASAVLAICLRQRESGPPASYVPFDDWDIPRLVAYLNEEGLALRLVAVRKDGVIDREVFLTITDKTWNDLSRLRKDPKRIQEWRGVISCERVGRYGEPALHLLGDHCLVAGRFVFFGDAELLKSIHTVLMATEPAAAP